MMLLFAYCVKSKIHFYLFCESRKSNGRKLIWVSYYGKTCSVNSTKLLDTRETTWEGAAGNEAS